MMAEGMKNSLYKEALAVEEPFISYLLNTRLSENLNILRAKIISEQVYPSNNQQNAGSIEQFQKEYPSIAFDCLQRQHLMLERMAEEYHKAQLDIKTRRYSVDFDTQKNEAEAVKGFDEVQTGDKVDEIGSIDEIGSTAELRRRLLGKRANNHDESEKSSERQIEDQDNLQNSLIEDMTKLVGSLRQGAAAFQNALNEDKAVLSAAEIGVQAASTSLTDVSGKLRKYDKKKLGYIFYITAFLAMFVGLIITFIIIQLFPAL